MPPAAWKNFQSFHFPAPIVNFLGNDGLSAANINVNVWHDLFTAAPHSGRRFRILNVIEDYSQECPACIFDPSLSGRRVIRELSAITERRGLPCMVVSG